MAPAWQRVVGVVGQRAHQVDPLVADPAVGVEVGGRRAAEQARHLGVDDHERVGDRRRLVVGHARAGEE